MTYFDWLIKLFDGLKINDTNKTLEQKKINHYKNTNCIDNYWHKTQYSKSRDFEVIILSININIRLRIK